MAHRPVGDAVGVPAEGEAVPRGPRRRLLSAVGAFALHELTAYWDVVHAKSRRTVTPGEQHVHSFLEVVPLPATAFMAVLHNDQARALLGIGDQRPCFALERKRQPLSRHYVRRPLGAITAFVAYTEELARCWRTARRDVAGAGRIGTSPIRRGTR